VGARTGRCRRNGPRKFFEALIGELLEFAVHELDMNAVQPDGATMRDHLENVRRQSGQTPDRLALAEANPCPEELRYLWNTWSNVSMRRQYDKGIAQAIPSTELKAYLELHGFDVTPFEAGVLNRLEQMFLGRRNQTALKGARTSG
jgi:hypothetical protein